MVDDFGVRYINKQDTDHLIMTLQKKYPIKMNQKGDYYLGMTLEWDYNKIHSNRNVQLSIPGYVNNSRPHHSKTQSMEEKYNTQT